MELVLPYYFKDNDNEPIKKGGILKLVHFVILHNKRSICD